LVREAVELSNEALAGPERIDLEAREPGVDGGRGNTVLPTQRPEDVLERRAGGAEAPLGQELADRDQAATPFIASAGNLQSIGSQQAETIRLLEGTSELRSGGARGQVDERLGNGGDGNPVLHSRLEPVDGGSVQANARTPAPPVRGGDVDRS
jgi:hypothetical protein